MSKLRVGPATLCRPPVTLPVKVAAVQQVAVSGPNITVEWRILCLQPRESNRQLVNEHLQPRTSLAVVQDEEQVGSIRHNRTAPETSSCR